MASPNDSIQLPENGKLFVIVMSAVCVLPNFHNWILGDC